MDRLDEASRRRQAWAPDGPRVRLADGQEWTFPRVRIRIAPAPPGEDGAAGAAVIRAACGQALPRWPDWHRALTSPVGTIDAQAYWRARMDAAVSMLRLHYSLSDGEMAELLWWEPEDDAARVRWDEIDAAVLGTSTPKPSPAG